MQTVTQEINKGFKDYGKHSRALTMLGSQQKNPPKTLRQVCISIIRPIYKRKKLIHVAILS